MADGLRVLIVSEHALVGDSVRTALMTRGHTPAVVRSGAHRASGRHDVGLLLTHSYDDGISRWAAQFLRHSTIPWLVLAPEERSPDWGGFYASGATLVVSPGAGLDEVCRLLVVLAQGRGPSLPRGSGELIRAWQQQLRDRDELSNRFSSLTPREHEVLRELYDGVAVRGIAQGSDVAEATVRTQVKAILRKLDVPSQIAAVAAYTQVQN